MVTRNDIIGQANLLDLIDNLVKNNSFPRFSILIGNTGTGKKLITNYIADKLNMLFVPCENKIDSVREIIEMSYTNKEPTCYMWSNADTMSLGAKNAILKITEEPPSSSYFIMTLNNRENMLPTILSRGTSFNINPYSPNDIKNYINARSFNNDTNIMDNLDIILNICTSPGEVDIIKQYNITNFVKFVKTVIGFIGKASLANTLKLSNSFKLKKDDENNNEKYDIITFLKCVNCICNKYILEEDTDTIKYANLCTQTCKSLSEFKISSVSKLAVIDNWLINARTIMRG